jgi:hypothetical protein
MQLQHSGSRKSVENFSCGYLFALPNSSSMLLFSVIKAESNRRRTPKPYRRNVAQPQTDCGHRRSADCFDTVILIGTPSEAFALRDIGIQ